MVYRLIAPEWLKDVPKVLEGEFTEAQVLEYNAKGYNCYFLPNSPSIYIPNKPVAGSDIDTFSYVFVDMDLKDGKYESKEHFLGVLDQGEEPTTIIDSGNGIHAYWQVSDLTAESFLRLQRRLLRYFNTDEAVAKIYQLMRVPGTINTKKEDSFKECKILQTMQNVYTCEQLDKWLPPITKADEEYCVQHYNKTYRVNDPEVKIDEKLPHKFMKLLKTSKKVAQLYRGEGSDRSGDDYHLAHIMFAEGFSKDEALSVLVNCAKARERAPIHRINYALGIADKVWDYELNGSTELLSNSVEDILKRPGAKRGTPFPCSDMFDNTLHGFRLTQVLGLVAAAGSGKTTLALNYFYHFVKLNPEYIHLFVALEQPDEEIAVRWSRMVEGNEALNKKVHVLSNYKDDGTYRNLSLSEIEEYVLELEKRLKVKVGCVVIDHIGVLRKQNKDGENQGLIDICHYMKAFAKRTNTFLVMQSQTSRGKAGIGDLELDKDAAYGTSMFEWYCDYVVTTWQPLKLMYSRHPNMTVTSFKYAKIRHKNVLKDTIKEDLVYKVMYDPNTELLRRMTADENKSYHFLVSKVEELKKIDKKKTITEAIDPVGKNGKVDNDTHKQGSPSLTRVS